MRTFLSIVIYIIAVIIILSSIAHPKNSKAYTENKEERRKAQITGVIFGLFILLVGWIVWPSDVVVNDNKGIAKQNEEKHTTKVNIDNIPVEKKLAILDAKGDVPDTSIKIIRIRVLLNKLSKEYNEPIDSIAELTSKAQGIIHDQGIDESCLSILERIHRINRPQNLTYTQAIAVYALLKTQ